MTMCTFCSIKCWFFFFNSLFLASGITLISIGAVNYCIYSQIGTFAVSGLSKIAIILIAVGVTIALTSILGHVGAFTENISAMACFICILIMIITSEILTGAAFYIFHSRTTVIQVTTGITSKARGVIHDYNQENRLTIDRIQEKFRCCGADSYTDWSRSVGWENRSALPDSCCLLKGKGCGQDKTNIHTKGCIWAIKLFLQRNVLWVGAVCIALGVTEVFGVLVGLFLCLDIKRRNYESL